MLSGCNFLLFSDITLRLPLNIFLNAQITLVPKYFLKKLSLNRFEF
jgi:hypothetical protein